MSKLQFSVGWGDLGLVKQVVTVEPAPTLVQGYAKALNDLPVRDNGWWSSSVFMVQSGGFICPHKYSEGPCTETSTHTHRNKEYVMSASAIQIDLDYVVNGERVRWDANEETKAAAERVQAMAANASTSGMPGTLFHTTPRGIRLIYVLDKQVSALPAQPLFERARRGAGALVTKWLTDNKLLGRKTKNAVTGTTGFDVDAVVEGNSAGYLWTPNSRVKLRGMTDWQPRSAQVLALNEEPTTAEELAKHAPTEVCTAPVAGPSSKDSPAREFEDPQNPDLIVALANVYADYLQTNPPFPPSGSGECPICGHRGCWGQMRDCPEKWFCFSSGHERWGVKDEAGWMGDALDILMFWDNAEGVDRIKWLKEHTRPGTEDYYLDKKFEPVSYRGLDPAQYVYDCDARVWREFSKLTESWAEVGMKEDALSRYLTNRRFNKKSVERFKAAVQVIRDCQPFYETMERFVRVGEHVYLNLYQASTLQPAAGDWSDIRLLLLNLCSGDEKRLEFTLDWLARIVQGVRAGKPLRMGTALVFYGAKGAGKDVFALCLRALLGAGNVLEIGQDELDNPFNGWAYNKLMFIGNEVFSSGNRSKATTNKVKSYITEADRVINPKNLPQHTRRVWDNWIFFSNDTRPVVVEGGDRRFSCFKVAGKIARELGGRVADDARAGGAGIAAFLEHLLGRVSKVNPHDIYQTEEKAQLEYDSGNSAEKFARDVRDLGFHSVTGPWAEARKQEALRTKDMVAPDYTYWVERKGGMWVTREKLNGIYAAWCRAHTHNPLNSTTLLAALREMFPDFKDKPLKVSGRSVFCAGGLPGVGELVTRVEGDEEGNAAPDNVLDNSLDNVRSIGIPR